MPTREKIHRISARVDRGKVGTTLRITSANGAVPPGARGVVRYESRRTIVVAVVDAQPRHGDARSQVSLDPAQQRPRIAIGRVGAKSELKGCLGVALAALPRQHLCQAGERLRIVRVRFQYPAPGFFATVQLASPRNHASKTLGRRSVAGFRQLRVHALGFVELAVPGESARIVHCGFAVDGVVPDPGFVNANGFGEPSRPRQGLRATENGVARPLVGGDQRIVRCDRRFVTAAPRQRAGKGDSAFSVTRLLGDVATVQLVCLVEAVVPGAEGGQSEDRDRSRIGIARHNLRVQ